jgi:hypothetical protein
MDYLDLAVVRAALVRAEPFEHLLVREALAANTAAAISAAYPVIDKPGSFALADLELGPALRQLIAELDSDAFRDVIAEKLGVDLCGKPTTFTLRGACGRKDGQIHTDSKSKIVTILLYLNESWAPTGGRLRLLRNGRDLDDFTTEIEPAFGAMLAFRRSDRSWHGHLPYEGPRRVLQMNYVASERASLVSDLRHRLSALTKMTAAGA